MQTKNNTKYINYENTKKNVTNYTIKKNTTTKEETLKTMTMRKR